MVSLSGITSPSFDTRKKNTYMNKTTLCLWYNHDTEDAAKFYASTFPNSTVGAVHRAPSDFPGGKQGDVLTVEFNGGDIFTHSEAFSFQIATDDQAETDHYWNAIIEGGDTAKRTFDAMMHMQKIGVATIEAAVRGK